MKQLKCLFYNKSIFLYGAACCFIMADVLWMNIKIQGANSLYTSDVIRPIMQYSIFYFWTLFLVSVQFLYIYRQYAMDEVLDVVQYKKAEREQMRLLIKIHCICTSMFCALFVCLSLVYNSYNWALAKHAILQCLINIGLVGILAIIIGKNISMIGNPIIKVVAIVFVSIMVSPIKRMFLGEGKESLSFIEIFPDFIEENRYMAYPIQIQRIAVIFFWFFLNLIIYAFFLLRSTKRAIIMGVYGVIIAVAFGIFQLPRTDLTGLGKYSEIFYARGHYDMRVAVAEKKTSFNVEEYNLDLDFFNMLYATAEMKLENYENLSEYEFTLYHSYQVKQIYDSNGKTLKYKRNEDYLIVYGDNLDKIIIEYEGSGTPMYTEFLGAGVMPGFSFYPIAGIRNVFDYKNDTLAPIELEKETEFNVKINANYKVYTNLDETNYNEFSGKSKAFFCLGGYVSEYIVDGTKFIYPALYNEKIIRERVDGIIQYSKEDDISIGKILDNKTVIFMPLIGASTEVYFDDVISIYEVFEKKVFVSRLKEQYFIR